MLTSIINNTHRLVRKNGFTLVLSRSLLVVGNHNYYNGGSLINTVTSSIVPTSRYYSRNNGDFNQWRRDVALGKQSKEIDDERSGIPTTLDHSMIPKDTIFALSSGSGKAGVAIIRISGPQCKAVFKSLTNSNIKTNKKEEEDNGMIDLKPRYSTLHNIYHPKSKEQIDRAMVIWFPNPNSFTGEDVLELHVHGGRAVVHDTLEALSCVPGTRSALPGEFTRRALENGKMDLAEVEGLADLLDAQTGHQRRVALKQMQGSLSRFANGMRDRLIRASAYTEAFIDFGDDAEIDPEVVEASKQAIIKLRNDIQQHINDGRVGERLRDGATITIIGPPNAGKSSLINILAKRKASIVSDIPGTTRDVVEVVLDIGGYPVVLGDTAGIRDLLSSSNVNNNGHNQIESIGIELAKERTMNSDITICVFDCKDLVETGSVVDPVLLSMVNTKTIFIFNKIDILTPQQLLKWTEIKKDLKQILLLNRIVNNNQNNNNQEIQYCEISCHHNTGVQQLLNIIESNLKKLFQVEDIDAPLLTRLRHKEHLIHCVESLDRYLDYCDSDIVIAAEELRNAIRSIGAISYHVNVDDLLDVIFRDFCIGK